MPPKKVAVKRKAVQMTLDGGPVAENTSAENKKPKVEVKTRTTRSSAKPSPRASSPPIRIPPAVSKGASSSIRILKLGDSPEPPLKPEPTDEGIQPLTNNATGELDPEIERRMKDPDPLRHPHFSAQEAQDNGVILRKFYPPEMSNARALAYKVGEIPRPIELLRSALRDTAETRRNADLGNSVVHWFKQDLRIRDNKALHMASEKAREEGKSLVGMYIVSPQDFEAHLTSPVRVDFVLRTLEVLRGDLAELDIPLYVESVERRRDIPARIEVLMREWGANHLYATMEYEVDELRREAKMIKCLAQQGISFDVVHDTCVVQPGALQSGAGKQYSVYSPWFRAWIAYLQSNHETLSIYAAPSRNPISTRDRFKHLFDTPMPDVPTCKSLTDEEKARLRPLWPAGEHEALARLSKFCDGKIHNYQVSRSFPSIDGTSSLSVHFSSGTLSARTAVKTARDANTTKKLDGGNPGITTWISEVAWRDFYKHVLVNWPYVCMNKPFKPEYTNITWNYNDELFKTWCEGRTGYPIVDAGMRQLLGQGYMANRLRMVTASFLAKDLLIDWRMGERFFMEHLIDGDFASNNGGWGFSASTGVDPQPYFRIFNPLLQSEKFDTDGEYIRRWVPELRGVSDKAIHAPYERGAGAVAQKAGYPKPCVVHKGAREETIRRYKEGLGRSTA